MVSWLLDFLSDAWEETLYSCTEVDYGCKCQDQEYHDNPHKAKWLFLLFLLKYFWFSYFIRIFSDLALIFLLLLLLLGIFWLGIFVRLLFNLSLIFLSLLFFFSSFWLRFLRLFSYLIFFLFLFFFIIFLDLLFFLNILWIVAGYSINYFYNSFIQIHSDLCISHHFITDFKHILFNRQKTRTQKSSHFIKVLMRKPTEDAPIEVGIKYWENSIKFFLDRPNSLHVQERNASRHSFINCAFFIFGAGCSNLR